MGTGIVAKDCEYEGLSVVILVAGGLFFEPFDCTSDGFDFGSTEGLIVEELLYSSLGVGVLDLIRTFFSRALPKEPLGGRLAK